MSSNCVIRKYFEKSFLKNDILRFQFKAGNYKFSRKITKIVIYIHQLNSHNDTCSHGAWKLANFE